MFNWFIKLFPNLIKNNVIVENLLFEVGSLIDNYNRYLDKKLNNDV